MTGDIELGDLEGLLFIDAHTPLRQLKHGWRAHIDLQAVGEQFALDAFLVLAALRHVIGTAAQQQGAAHGGAPEGQGVSSEHGVSIWVQRAIRA